MKNFKALFVLFIAAAVMVIGAAVFAPQVCAAAIDGKNMIVEDGTVFILDGKGGRKESGAIVEEQETSGGVIYFVDANPDADGMEEGLYKGWTKGFYFFGADGKFISCLEIDKAGPGGMGSVMFSPGGKWFVHYVGSSSSEPSEYKLDEYKLYEFDGLKVKKDLRDFYGLWPFWLDDGRFAFTRLDAKRGSRGKSAPNPGWMSVVVYDIAADELTAVAEATATETEDYMLSEADRDAGELVILRYSVKKPEDWAKKDWNNDTENDTYIRVPIPAAK
jgi:hypothetical protein